MATIKELKNGHFKITVSDGYDIRGKQIRYFKTWIPLKNMSEPQKRKEVNRQALLFEMQCKNGEPPVSESNIKLEKYAEQWLKDIAGLQNKLRTVEEYRKLSVRCYKEIGHLKLCRITRKTLQNFILSMEKEGLSLKTIKNHIAFISSVLSYAVKQDIINANPCRDLCYPKQKQLQKKSEYYYSLEETIAFLNTLPKAPLKYQTFFSLALFGGFRLGELLGLEWSDIDFTTNIITINRTSLYSKNIGMFSEAPKTKKSRRSNKMPQLVMDLLLQLKLHQSTERETYEKQWKDTNRLFVGTGGCPLFYSTPLKWLKRFLKRNNLPDTNIHGFRHLNASLLISSGIDVKTVSEYLGHSKPTTTLNIYAHTFEIEKAKASQALAEQILPRLNMVDDKEE